MVRRGMWQVLISLMQMKNVRSWIRQRGHLVQTFPAFSRCER